jgi:hypothetical protein
MEYQVFPLRCRCGRVPKQILAIGLSSSYDLIIEWRCRLCYHKVYVTKTLAESWQYCRRKPMNVTNSNLLLDNADDRRFLRSLGVTFPDEYVTTVMG